jgi:hypothetical protein
MLRAQQRDPRSVAAPARGLCLERVFYDWRQVQCEGAADSGAAVLKEASCGSDDPRAAALPGWPEFTDATLQWPMICAELVTCAQ